MMVGMWWLAWLGCSGSSAPPVPEAADPEPAAKAEPEGPEPVLVMVQAQFLPTNKPGPAKAVFYRKQGRIWTPETLEDPESNVWHKAVFWRDGLLTIGAEKALLKHWTRTDGVFRGQTLYEAEFGGKFDRFRDVEIGDVDADGAEEIVLATHDAGVVAVGDETDGAWSFQQFDKAPDTFVHEVEIGDVDGDGKQEFYVTPSERNRASGASQPGGVYRYDVQPDGTYARTPVVEYTATHAKEILVTDLDGDGTDELYVVKEGVTVVSNSKTTLEEPVTIERYTRDEAGQWSMSPVAELPGESQCRFLVAGDVDHDGDEELVAAAKSTGLWRIEPDGEVSNIATDTGGFEHATHLADLDGDGKLEIYAASEQRGNRLLRRYVWDGEGFRAEVMAPIPDRHITWNLADGSL